MPWSRAELLSACGTVDVLVALETEDEQEPKTADGYEAECERGRVVGRGRAAKPAWGRRV